MPGWADGVTLLQLIHHSSGNPEYYGDLAPKRWEPATLNKQEALAEISAAKKRRFQPGTKWEYSNSNYLLSAWSSSTSAASRWKPYLGIEYSTLFSSAWPPTPASR